MNRSTMRLIKPAATLAATVSEGDTVTHVTRRLTGSPEAVCAKMRIERCNGSTVIHWRNGGVMGIEFITITESMSVNSLDPTEKT